MTANNMKHVARRHFYVREIQEMGLIRVCWWHGKGNEADALTKALPKVRHMSLTKNILLPPGPRAREGERGSSS